MKKLMRYLIFILVALLIFAIVLMFVSPKTIEFEESISIEAPSNVVFNLVNDLEDWQLWSPIVDLDPKAEHSYTDKIAGAGAQWTWNGNDDVGKGSLTIKESESPSRIKSQLSFNNMKSQPIHDWAFTSEEGETKVRWGFSGYESSFFTSPLNYVMKNWLQTSYAAALKRLKQIAEQRAKENIYNGYKIDAVEVDNKHYIMNRQEVEISQMQQFYAQNLGALFMKLNQAQLEMDGMPSGLFFSWDEASEKTDMAAAIPTKEAVSIEGALSHMVPGGRALRVDYYGDYHGTSKAHEALSDYIRDHDLFLNYPLIHEYVTDPTAEKDPNKWLTKMTYYVTGPMQ